LTSKCTGFRSSAAIISTSDTSGNTCHSQAQLDDSS
jgi:hypothetical protein